VRSASNGLVETDLPGCKAAHPAPSL